MSNENKITGNEPAEDIFYNGRIYVGVKIKNKHQRTDILFLNSWFSYALNGYDNLKNGQVLTKNKDYELKNVCASPACSCMSAPNPYCRKNSQGETKAFLIDNSTNQ